MKRKKIGEKLVITAPSKEEYSYLVQVLKVTMFAIQILHIAFAPVHFLIDYHEITFPMLFIIFIFILCA